MRKFRLAHAHGDVMGKAESMAIHTDRKGLTFDIKHNYSLGFVALFYII